MKFLTTETNETGCEVQADSRIEPFINGLVSKAAQIRMTGYHRAHFLICQRRTIVFARRAKSCIRRDNARRDQK
jgi:hypothetical protein